MMLEHNKRTIPIVEKITEFSVEDWNNKEITFVEKDSMRHLYGISPIVMYRAKCDKDVETPSLNAFIKSIFVCKAKSILCAKYEGNRLFVTKRTTDEIFCLFEAQSGIVGVITYPILIEALIKKPDLLVSPEGVLLFATDTQVVASTDLKQCVLIIGKTIELKNRKIKTLVNRNEYSILHLVDEDGKDYIYNLIFHFNLAWRPMFTVQAAFITKTK